MIFVLAVDQRRANANRCLAKDGHNNREDTKEAHHGNGIAQYLVGSSIKFLPGYAAALIPLSYNLRLMCLSPDFNPRKGKCGGLIADEYPHREIYPRVGEFLLEVGTPLRTKVSVKHLIDVRCGVLTELYVEGVIAAKVGLSSHVGP